MIKLTLVALAALISVAPARAAVDDAAREASLRTGVETVLTMSDEDYRDMAKQAPTSSRWAQLERPALLRISFKSLAASRRRRAVAEGLVSAGRVIDADAMAAGPDADLIQETGWWSDAGTVAKFAGDYYKQKVNSYTSNTRTPTAVAAVRGGRKLSTDADKEVTRLLAAVDTGDKALLDASLTPSKRGQIHLDASLYYDKIAAIVAEPAPEASPVPEAPVVKAMSAKEIYQSASPSVVLILAAEKAGSGELGTGSVISGGRILTNAHVVINDKTGRPFGSIRIYLKPERVSGDTKRDLKAPINATVSRFDRGFDLAILEPESKIRVSPLTLGDDSTVETGDPVVAIGHPEQGGLWTLTQGVVSTVIADLGGIAGKDAFQTDTSINRGNSGGPLIDRSGAIIGVNTSMARKAADGLTITSVNFSVKSSVALRWLGEDTAPATAIAVAPVAPVVVAPAPIAAPAAEIALPPAPKTKPVVLTPQAPYLIEDVLASEMREMEDLEGEMRREIESRRR